MKGFLVSVIKYTLGGVGNDREKPDSSDSDRSRSFTG